MTPIEKVVEELVEKYSKIHQKTQQIMEDMEADSIIQWKQKTSVRPADMKKIDIQGMMGVVYLKCVKI